MGSSGGIENFWISVHNAQKRPQIISALHRRFPTSFSTSLIPLLTAALAQPPRDSSAQGDPASDQREKEDAARITRQRPVLRVAAELALTGVIRDKDNRSGGEWIMKILKDLVRVQYDLLETRSNLQGFSSVTILPYLPSRYSALSSNHTHCRT